MRCGRLGCLRQTFREQPVGIVQRYQRRTVRLAAHVARVARELAGRASARVLAAVGVVLSRQTALREAWLREHPGVEVVCRDGSATMLRRSVEPLPDAVQVGDRWHLWHNLGEVVLKEVAAHSTCWSKIGPSLREGARAATIRQRWQQIHDLLNHGVGLLEIARRLNLALTTVKRYARIDQPDRLVRAPQYRPRPRRPVPRLPAQPPPRGPGRARASAAGRDQQRGYTGSHNLLYRYITQGRVESDRPAISPKRLTRYLLTRPDKLQDHQRERLEAAVTACHQMTALAALVGDFAALFTPTTGNDDRLSDWIDQARAEDLPHLRAYTRGLEFDRQAVNATLTQPFHNGRSIGVNTKNQDDQTADVQPRRPPLLRHRILLG
jgi:hypothetical protein